MEGLKKKFPNAAVVLTLGDKGSWYFDRGKCIRQEIYKVKTVDTTQPVIRSVAISSQESQKTWKCTRS